MPFLAGQWARRELNRIRCRWPLAVGARASIRGVWRQASGARLLSPARRKTVAVKMRTGYTFHIFAAAASNFGAPP